MQQAICVDIVVIVVQEENRRGISRKIKTESCSGHRCKKGCALRELCRCSGRREDVAEEDEDDKEHEKIEGAEAE